MEMLRGQRIAVTGHTSGIGKEIYEYCQTQPLHQVYRDLKN